jgi:DNA polymerase-1
MGIGGALPNMRRMYRARPGWAMMGADWSQLELRVMRDVSRDEQLEANLASGDVYSEDAKLIFKLPSSMRKCDCKVSPCAFPNLHVKKSVRQGAKIGHLGFQYGAGTPTIYTQALEQDQSIKYSFISMVHSELKRIYAGTVRYWFEEQERVRSTGYSESRIMGRRRNYPREPELTEIANYPIQATAADVANIVELDLVEKRLPKYRNRKTGEARVVFLLQLYDAFYFETHPDVAEDWRAEVKESMEQPFTVEGRKCIYPTEIKYKVKEQDGSERLATHWSDL